MNPFTPIPELKVISKATAEKLGVVPITNPIRKRRLEIIKESERRARRRR